MRRPNLKLLFEPPADVREEAVPDPAELADGDGVQGDDHRRGGVAAEHQCLGVQGVVDGRRVAIRDVDLGGSGLELSRLGGQRREQQRGGKGKLGKSSTVHGEILLGTW